MPRRHEAPEELARAPFARAAGIALVGHSALRSAAYRPVVRGAHWVSGEPLDQGRMIEAYRAVLPGEAVLGGWSAAWVHGMLWAPDGMPVEVVLPAADRVRTRADLVVRADLLRPDEVVASPLGPVTTAARTAFDLARRPDPRPFPRPSRRPRVEGFARVRSRAVRETQAAASRLWIGDAVAAVDALLRQTGASPEDVVELIARHPGSRGCRRAAEVMALVDPRAESPRESLLRVLLVQAGLPTPELQVEVMDGTRFVARLDLAWPELKRGMEYDGAHHREAEQHARDLRRHNDLRNLDWRVLQVDAEQFANPDRVIADARRLLTT